MLLRPAPWSHDDRLVWVTSLNPRSGRVGNVPYADYLAYRDHATTMSAVLASGGTALSVGSARPQRVLAGLVSGNYQARVGYVPEEAHLYTFLSAREHLELIGRLRRLPAHLLTRKISALLDLLGLASAADQPISGYSKGMKQKVLLITALLHDPDLLILDEPESGLDLTAGLVLRHLIPILAARGKTILYSSHVLDHVERLCADVVVLDHGRIVAEGPVSQLRAMTERNASLEDVIAQLVTSVDPARTAGEIADVSGLNA